MPFDLLPCSALGFMTKMMEYRHNLPRDSDAQAGPESAVLFWVQEMVKSPNAVPGQPPNRYGCAGTAEEPFVQSLDAECRRHGGRRRAQLVIGGITLIVAALAICDLFTTNLSSNYSFQQYASALLEAADSPSRQPTAQDVADCSGFQGWLQSDCLKSKTEDRKSVSFWTDEQVVYQEGRTHKGFIAHEWTGLSATHCASVIDT